MSNNYYRIDLTKPRGGERINEFAFFLLITFASTISTIYLFPMIWAYQENQSDKINATDVYESHSMILSPNVKSVIILIPNEAHEPSSLQEKQLINQAFIPKYVKLHIGTKIVFFNADVDHKHHVLITKGVNDAEEFDTGILSYNDVKVFDTGILSYNDVEGYHDVKENNKLNNNNSRDYIAFQQGTFHYYDTIDGQTVMNGTIQLLNSSITMKSIERSVNQLKPGFDIIQSPENVFDTVGTFVVPTDTVNEYITYFKNEGLQIYDIHNFRNLMKDDIKAENSLLVWTSYKIPLDLILTKLKEITPTLPYS